MLLDIHLDLNFLFLAHNDSKLFFEVFKDKAPLFLFNAFPF